MAVYKRESIWWYKFTWNGECIRKSTKQTNKRIAEQIQAAHKTALAKGEVGIRDKKRPSTLKEFAERDFLPYVHSHFAEKPSTLAYYQIQVAHLIRFEALGNSAVDAIESAVIGGFVAAWRAAGYEVSSINRALQVLRRMLRLAVEWGTIEKTPARVSLLPGERRRERVLTSTEETLYLKASQAIGESILAAYQRALGGIRATRRDEMPTKPEDSFLLRDVATVLLDCGLRPEECYRLRWEHVRDNALHIPFGKTSNARRSIPLPQRCTVIFDIRRSMTPSAWVFPAPTKSGHIEQSTLKKRHAKACELAGLEHVPFYTFRHTCLTRWAAHMDPYTLAYFAGHSDFGTTRRYVHPNLDSGRDAMERARNAQGGHNPGTVTAGPMADGTSNRLQ